MLKSGGAVMAKKSSLRQRMQENRANQRLAPVRDDGTVAAVARGTPCCASLGVPNRQPRDGPMRRRWLRSSRASQSSESRTTTLSGSNASIRRRRPFNDSAVTGDATSGMVATYPFAGSNVTATVSLSSTLMAAAVRQSEATYHPAAFNSAPALE